MYVKVVKQLEQLFLTLKGIKTVAESHTILFRYIPRQPLLQTRVDSSNREVCNPLGRTEAWVDQSQCAQEFSWQHQQQHERDIVQWYCSKLVLELGCTAVLVKRRRFPSP